jgi:PIN domain nuclease of toxin-antitoxin system
VTALLDTHIVLWWLADSPLLSDTARTVVANGANTIFVSAATAWEMAIKQAAGKLQAPGDLESVLRANRFEMLPITVTHALAAGALPPHHADPFDRMLVAQAELEGMTLLTHDARLPVYGRFVCLV